MKIYIIGNDHPDEGHTFQFSMSSRTSGEVVGDPKRTDADYFTDAPNVVRVRAWNLEDAIRKLANHASVFRAFMDSDAAKEVSE